MKLEYLDGLKMTPEEKERFVVAVKVKMLKMGLNVREISDRIGYSPKSVYSYFAKCENGNSRFINAALAEVLDIKEEEWR